MVSRRDYIGLVGGATAGILAGGDRVAGRGRPRSGVTRGVRSGAPTQEAKLVPTDGDGGDLFGWAVALDGSTALVGASGDEDPNGDDAGAVYAFERTGEKWSQQAKLTADDGDGDDFFGVSVALDGSTALVGASGEEDPNGEGAGAVYAFERSDGEWRQQAKLTPDGGDSEDAFGFSVALDGSTALVGTHGHEAPDEDGGGAVYAFERTGGEWRRDAKLTPDEGDSGFTFGFSVALDGSTAFVGAPEDHDPNGFDAGSAYAFERTDGEWVRQAKLAAPDGDEKDRFGWSVAVDAPTAVVGAWKDEDPNGLNAGSAYAFERTDGEWVRQAKLAAPDGDEKDRFGWSVAADGSRTLVGAKLDGNPDGIGSGAAYAFERTDGEWGRPARLAAADGDDEDFFGNPVALDGSTALVGAYGDEDPNGDRAGSAYVFELGDDDTRGIAVRSVQAVGGGTPPDVWTIGDVITFRVTVVPAGDGGFRGETHYGIEFRDLHDEGSVDAGWIIDRESDVLLYRRTFTRTLDLDPDERTIVELDVPLTDAFDRLIEGGNPSLTFTDRVQLAAGATPEASRTGWIDDTCDTAPCITPRDPVIRPGILEVASVALAYFGAAMATGPADVVRPGAEDVPDLTIEMTDAYTRAMQEKRANKWSALERTIEGGLTVAGYPSVAAATMAEYLTKGFEADAVGNQAEATEWLLRAEAARVRENPLTYIHSALEPFLEFLLAGFVNLGDLYPTVGRGLSNLQFPVDVTTTRRRTRTDVAPRAVTGVLLDRRGTPVEGATVQVYADDPRTGADPIMDATTDGDGRFAPGTEGPASATILWFEARVDGVPLTDKPLTRAYRPDDRTGGLYSYRLPVERADTTAAPSPKPAVAVDAETVPSLDRGLPVRVRYSVSDATADRMPWGSAGGIHLRVVNGRFAAVPRGDFDTVTLADQLGEPVSDIEDAAIAELTVSDSLPAGSELETGKIPLVAAEGVKTVRLAYRAWGYDRGTTLTVDGEDSPYIARAPTGPNYNRHVVEPGYTFLNYPRRVIDVPAVGGFPDVPVPGTEPPIGFEGDGRLTLEYLTDLFDGML